MKHRSSILILLAVACSGPRADSTRQVAPQPAGDPLAAVLPSPAGSFAPAHTRVVGEGDVDGLAVADIAQCKSCHPDVFKQQQASAHAESSFSNPIYRFGIDRLRDKVGKRPSQMCGGCHDIALLIDNAMLGDVRPYDPRAHAGVTCRVCHGIKEATLDGNGSYTLARTPIPIPDLDDEASIERHRQAVRPIEPNKLCGSCHRSFLDKETGNDHFLTGQDDLGSYLTSPYAATGLGRFDNIAVKRETCISCHMKPEKASDDVAADERGQVSSHRFLGGHTWLAAMGDNAEQLRRQQEFLKGTVTVDVPAGHVDGTWFRPVEAIEELPVGSRVGFDVVVRNVGVGHHFPGGTRDAVDSWLAVSVSDARGEVIAASAGDDVHRFRVLVGDRNAIPQMLRNTQDFWEPIVNHTIGPRDARVVRYELDVTEAIAADRLPLRVDVQLIHRSRNEELREAVCAETRSERGKAFAQFQEQSKGKALDPCVPQPQTIVDQHTAWLGPGAAGRADNSRPLPLRLWEHALGLNHRLPDRASDSRETLEAALALTGDDDPKMKARLLLALATVHASAPCGPSAPSWTATCIGRIDRVKEILGRSELLAGHPVANRVLAWAYHRFWLHRDAARHLRVMVDKASDNPAAWRELALVLAPLGEHQAALEAANKALVLMPRDDDLLRALAVSLDGLGAPRAQIESAWEAYRKTARADRPIEMRARCATQLDLCRVEQLEVHTHELKPPSD